MRRTRVRFAPSPTGPLHMGGVRTALYNYLYAKKNGGDFIIRIEDTDSTRFVPGAEKYIIESLSWCGIIPDEGIDAYGNVVETPSGRHPHAPYRQSQRKSIYRKYAEELVEKGFAYYAFDSAEELSALRASAEAEKRTFTYNHATRESLRNSLTLPKEEVARLLEQTGDWTIRFKTPKDRIVEMDDVIRGHIEVNTNTLDDKVLWKRADELPTYHLANIVDDHLMEISDVIRGEEWLPSLPLHYLLYEAFGWQESQPRFAHLSLLLKPDGKGKLSKRDGDKMGFPVFPTQWINPDGEIYRGYREDGYYPEAFVNLLALLGWNPGTEQELFTIDELKEVFTLERVVKSGARFNFDKAKWFNQEYLRKRPIPSLVEEFKKLNAGKLEGYSDEYIGVVLEMMRERAHFAYELWDLTSFFFEAPVKYDEASVNKFWKEDIPQIIAQVREFIAALPNFDKETIESSLHELITSREWSMGKVMNTLRLFMVGASKGPGVADMMAIFGREETLRRIDNGIKTLA